LQQNFVPTIIVLTQHYLPCKKNTTLINFFQLYLKLILIASPQIQYRVLYIYDTDKYIYTW